MTRGNRTNYKTWHSCFFGHMSSALPLQGLTARDLRLEGWNEKLCFTSYTPLPAQTVSTPVSAPPPPPPPGPFVLSLCNKLIWFTDQCSKIIVSEQPVYWFFLLFFLFQGSSFQTNFFDRLLQDFLFYFKFYVYIYINKKQPSPPPPKKRGK